MPGSRPALHALLVLAVLAGSAISAHAAAVPRAGTQGTDWLTEINSYRTASGLVTVTEQPAWTQGLANHLVYLAQTPDRHRTGVYVNDHVENPASPYYTESGAQEAASSDLVSGGTSSAVGAIDGWLVAPFHAIGMLRPQLRQVAFARDASSGAAGLDVIQGLDQSAPGSSAPVLFPGDGLNTNLKSFGGAESPDPLETCGWRGLEVGLPLVALLPQVPDAALSATLSRPDGAAETTGQGNLCVVDEKTYTSSDYTYGPNGAAILAADHAVVLIPRRSLSNGSYSVHVQQPGQTDISWSFFVYGTTSSPTGGGGPPAPSPGAGLPSGGQSLSLSLRPARGHSTLRAPAWTRGHRIRIELWVQRRTCRRHGSCRWMTTSHVRRIRTSAGHRTSVATPRLPAHGRVRVGVTMLPFTSADGWQYPAFTVRTIVY